jgi:hypothetical protein
VLKHSELPNVEVMKWITVVGCKRSKNHRSSPSDFFDSEFRKKEVDAFKITEARIF